MLERMDGQAVVLCIQDGSDLNFAERPGCVGPGLIGRNSRSKGTLGLHMHSTPAVNGDGIALGVPLIQFEAPDGRAGKRKPAELRMTQRWVRGLRDTAELAGQLRGTRPVAVMDREADVFELFAERRRLDGIDLLVRAGHNRSLGKDRPKLFDRLRAAPAQARLALHVPRSLARRGRRRHAAPGGERVAPGARGRGGAALADGPAAGAGRGTRARERADSPEHDARAGSAAPDGAEPLEWFLLTSVPVRTRSASSSCIACAGASTEGRKSLS